MPLALISQSSQPRSRRRSTNVRVTKLVAGDQAAIELFKDASPLILRLLSPWPTPPQLRKPPKVRVLRDPLAPMLERQRRVPGVGNQVADRVGLAD